MKSIELKDIDVEDIEDLLVRIESSFEIRIENGELEHVQTYGELCDFIKSKIQLDHIDDCTTQQAFYKLREAIISSLQIDRTRITPETSLFELLPRKSRETKVNRIEEKLGFELSLLRPSYFVVLFLTLLLFGSIVALFSDWKLGLNGLGLSIIGFWIANKTKNELDVSTIGELSRKMTLENYSKSRRNPKTFNRKEIDNLLTDWFSYELGIEKSKLTREATFI